MYFWINHAKRPAIQIVKNCVHQKNINSPSTVLSKQRIHIFSCENFKYFMSFTNSSVKETPITLSSPLLQSKNIELTVVSEQKLSSCSRNQQKIESQEYQQKTEVQDISSKKEAEQLSNKEKLKRAIKDYGATVIVFHVTISLMSLGISYLVISSGVDVASLLDKMGLDTTSNLTAGASTFVVAYAVHKMFAPIRISITLGSTPFIVRYLRRIGILKPPTKS